MPVVMFPCCPLPERSHCIHRGPYPPTHPHACSGIPTAGQGSMTPQETTRPHAPPLPARSHHVPPAHLSPFPSRCPRAPLPLCSPARSGFPIQGQEFPCPSAHLSPFPARCPPSGPGVPVSPVHLSLFPARCPHASQLSWTGVLMPRELTPAHGTSPSPAGCLPATRLPHAPLLSLPAW